MTIKRAVAVLLALAMIVGITTVFASCSKDTPSAETNAATQSGGDVTNAPATQGGSETGNTPTTDSPAVTAEKEYELPKIDCGEEVITFIIADTDGDMINNTSIFAEEDTGDSVDQAIYERNAKIMKELNCTIEMLEEYTSDYSVTGKYGQALLAGDSEIDIIVGRQWDDISAYLDGYVQELTSLRGTDADFINWENPYWASSYIDGINYGEKVYWLAGDINLRYSGGFYTVFVNDTLYDKSCAASFGDLNQLVYDGKWTYDNIIKMSQLAWQDVGTDSEKTDKEDILGIALPLWDNTNAMVISAGIPFSTENPDGSVTLNINTTNQRLADFGTKISELLNTNGVFQFGGDYGGAMNLLASDYALMVFGRLNQAQLYLRDMESDYHILPYPKFNEEQERYYSSVHDGVSIFGINNASNHIKESAAVLEALAIETRKTVRKEYYDYALKYKYSRDPEAAKMIDFIADAAYSDFAYVWGFSGGLDLGNFFRMNFTSKNMMNKVKQSQNAWSKNLGKLIDKHIALWENEK